MTVRTITPSEFKSIYESSDHLDIIDVRTPVEYREIHIDRTRNVPLDELKPGELTAARGDQSEPLYVLCKSGKRADKACRKILASGYDNVIAVEGGVEAVAPTGLPVIRGQRGVSIERQVRIVAGLMVAAGTGLGFWVTPWFLVVPAFVGLGLTFAGITDFCGMGLILARMPWNKVKSEECCSV